MCDKVRIAFISTVCQNSEDWKMIRYIYLFLIAIVWIQFYPTLRMTEIIIKKNEASSLGLTALVIFAFWFLSVFYVLQWKIKDLGGTDSTRAYLFSTFFMYLKWTQCHLSIKTLKPPVMTNMKIGKCFFSLKQVHKLLVLIFHLSITWMIS